MANINGTSFGDVLYGTDGDDRISGHRGDDYIYGQGGNNRVLGGAGNDTLYFSPSSPTDVDRYYGGDGTDSLELDIEGETRDVRAVVGAQAVLIGGAPAVYMDSVEVIDAITGTGNDLVSTDLDWSIFVSSGGGNDRLIGGSAPDSLDGEAGDDRLSGNGGGDTLFAGAGDDRIDGGAGDDRIDAGTGSDDYVQAGDGNDQITASGTGSFHGGAGTDSLALDLSAQTGAIRLVGGHLGIDGTPAGTIDGIETFTFQAGSGNDVISTGPVQSSHVTAGAGNDRLVGGAGTDTLTGDAGNDRIFGNGGQDILSGGVGDDRVFGNDGQDDLYGGDGNDYLDGGAGDDLLDAGTGNDRVLGGYGNDEIIARGTGRFYGGAGSDFLSLDLFGEAGDVRIAIGSRAITVNGTVAGAIDRIEYLSFQGGSGNDAAFGGSTLDYLNGGQNDDVLIGRGGRDIINGDDGDDRLHGDGGDDSLDGGAGGDRIDGGSGNDSASGDNGDDVLLGGEGNDQLTGDGGADQLRGGSGNDDLHGYSGTDRLAGGDGNDVLDGGFSADRLIGGLGQDLIYGGSGHDRFLWSSSDEGGDRIADFTPGQDALVFGSAAFGGIAAVNGDNFVANGAGVAEDAGDRFLYSTSTGSLFFDADGNGAGAKVLIAHIAFARTDPAHATIGASDFRMF